MNFSKLDGYVSYNDEAVLAEFEICAAVASLALQKLSAHRDDHGKVSSWPNQ